MKRYLKNRTILLLIFVWCCTTLFAQKSDLSKTSETGHVYGKIMDSKTKESIPFASVIILKKDSLIAGNLTRNNGEFSIDHLPFGKFNFTVKSIGYKTIQKSISITPQNEDQDIGNIPMELDETLLKEVEVETQKSAVEMNIDRKVFNVDKNITSKGGTATDIMKNIPSVTLDENGTARLRQNAAAIYIDGRPTTLTLDQIAADQVERVEVITNPSAKFEANASGGIINIVMKSTTKPGYYGVVSAGIGTNDHYNGMASINVKEKPIGFSLTYNYTNFKNPIEAYNYRTNLYNGSITGFYNADNNKVFQNTFNTGSAGLDYYINNRNTISLSENMTIGDFNTRENQIFKLGISQDSIISSGSRITNSTTHFENLTTKLRYKKTFPKKGKELTSDINYNILNINSHNDFTTDTYNSSGVLFPNNPDLQNTEGLNKGHTYTLQADYIDPLNDSSNLELGIRSNFKESTVFLDASYFSYYSFRDTIDPSLTNRYKVKDIVNAAYINYSFRYRKINYMIGLRMEQSFYEGTLFNNSNSTFQYSYPGNFNNIMKALFPSIFISKKLTQKQSLQVNISRKIGRPDMRQLSPNISSSDRKNYSIGNPLLAPEFHTLAEINFNHYFNKGNLLITLFFRNTQNPMTNFSYKFPSDSSILVNTTINGKQSNTLGTDNTFKYMLMKELEATLNLNLFYMNVDASYNNTSFSNNGFYYNSKLKLNYRLPKSWSVQLSGNYESPRIIPQGKEKELYFVDCGISKEFYKFITFTGSVSDLFDSKGKGNYLTTDQYIQNYWSRRETRYIKFTCMITFGKADTPIFKKRAQAQQSETEGGF